LDEIGVTRHEVFHCWASTVESLFVPAAGFSYRNSWLTC
jgi:hypothetical protein